MDDNFKSKFNDFIYQIKLKKLKEAINSIK